MFLLLVITSQYDCIEGAFQMNEITQQFFCKLVSPFSLN